MKITKSVKIFLKQAKSGRFNTTAVHRTLTHERKETISSPIYVQIEPTTYCNLRCVTCSRESYPRERLGNLTFENFKMMIDQIPSLVFVKLQGMGEPLINRDLFRMAEYAKSKGIIPNITTNGTLFTESNISSLLEDFENIAISFDAARKDTYEKIRVGANYEKVVANIRMLVKKRNETGKKTRIEIHYVVSKINQGELKESVKMFAEIGVDEFTAVGVQEWSATGNTYDKIKEVQLMNIDEVSKEAMEAVSDSKMKFSFAPLIDPRYNAKSCVYPWDSCFITFDGFVTSCCLRPDPRFNNFGNVFKDSFENIWNGEKYRNFRRCFLEGRISENCKNCPL